MNCLPIERITTLLSKKDGTKILLPWLCRNVFVFHVLGCADVWGHWELSFRWWSDQDISSFYSAFPSCSLGTSVILHYIPPPPSGRKSYRWEADLAYKHVGMEIEHIILSCIPKTINVTPSQSWGIFLTMWRLSIGAKETN